MYFWNIERLKAELRERPVPPVEVVRYSTAIVLTSSVAYYVPVPDQELRVADGILIVISVFVTAFGLWAAYRANGGPNGTDLAGRFLAVGWVIGLRLAVLLLAFMVVVFGIIMVQAFREHELSGRSIELTAWVTAVLTEIVFYWRLTHHLALVRGAA